MKTKMILLFIGVIFGLSGRIAAQNIVTVAGGNLCCAVTDGELAIACGFFPTAVTVDESGNVFCSDVTSNIYKITTLGIISKIAGIDGPGFSGDGGPATIAALNTPWGLATDKHNNIYIGDLGNSRIRRIDSMGVITTISGNGTPVNSGDGGPANAAQLYGGKIALDSNGNIFIAANNRIRKIDTYGLITTIAGGDSTGYSGDGGLATLAKIQSSGSIATDLFGNIYFNEGVNGLRIRKIDRAGIITTIAGSDSFGFSGDGGPATIARISSDGLTTDSAGNVYFSDYIFNYVRKISVSGMITTYVGNGELFWGGSTYHGGYNGDGIPAINAALYNPKDVKIDKNGDLYIADQNNFRVREVCNCTVNAVPEIRHNSTMSIYPNPNNGEFAVSLPAANSSGTITITDLLGKVVQVQNFPAQNGINVTIHLENMPPGPYLVKTDVGGEVFRDKVVRW